MPHIQRSMDICIQGGDLLGSTFLACRSDCLTCSTVPQLTYPKTINVHIIWKDKFFFLSPPSLSLLLSRTERNGEGGRDDGGSYIE